ncbi:MAG: HAMP domain-containing protein [Anaerolineales bacterium]|nr:HAMP domain-containing protein [Anaerolineales bacterium]
MNTVSRRLFAAFLAVIAVVLVSLSLGLIVLLRNNPLVERQTYSQLNSVAAALVREARLTPAMTPAEVLALAEATAAAEDVRVLVANANGDVLVDSSANAAALDFRRFRLARLDQTYPDVRVGQVRDAARRLWLYVVRPLGEGRVLIVAGRPAPFVAAAFFAQNLLLPMTEAAVIAALAAGVLAVVIARSIAQPLQKMAQVSQGIARGDYTQAAPETGPDEVRALGGALNGMARQVQATQQAQREFLANVSHELKTPLTSIQGFAQALLDGTADSPAVTEHAAQIIYTEAERMRRLVEGLLELARLEAGAPALRRSPLDLRAQLGAVLERFGPRAQAAGVTLVNALPAALPTLTADGDRLAQVFDNLLDNALKHTPAGGQVTLTALPTGREVVVAVSDTGAGIPAADLDRLFERFYQVDKSRARPGGVGLGLAISREIVAAHGGRMEAQSVVGQGSTFTVHLPLGAAA